MLKGKHYKYKKSCMLHLVPPVRIAVLVVQVKVVGRSFYNAFTDLNGVSLHGRFASCVFKTVEDR